MTAIKYTPPLGDLLDGLKTIVYPGTTDAVLHVPSKVMPRVANALNAHDDLLAALQAIVAEIDGPDRSYSADSYLPRKFVEQARAALAKVTGETT